MERQAYAVQKGQSYILKIPSKVRRNSLHDIYSAPRAARDGTVPAVTGASIQISCIEAFPAQEQWHKTLYMKGI